MDISSIYPDDSGYIFDSMVESTDSLFVIETSNLDQLTKQLATYHSFTGRVAYHWHANSGIKRFDLQHITLPNTKQLIDAIYHIANTKHFGIFLFSGFDQMLYSPMVRNVIEHFLESAKEHRKYIIFADAKPMIPSELKEKVQTLSIAGADSNQEPPIRTSYLYS